MSVENTNLKLPYIVTIPISVHCEFGEARIKKLLDFSLEKLGKNYSVVKVWRGLRKII